MSTRTDVERITDIFFRRFHVPALYIANPWMMALISNGNLTGLVLHVSDTATSIAPIYNVKTIDDAIRSVPIDPSELQTESGRKFVYEAAISALEACPRELWSELLERVIPSGPCSASLLDDLPANLMMMLSSRHVSKYCKRAFKKNNCSNTVRKHVYHSDFTERVTACACR